MFKMKQTVKVADGIPADLLKSIQAPAARRRRWMLEILVSLAIVLALLVGGMFAYKHFHRTNEPHSVPKSNAERVTQPPQSTDADSQTSQPAVTTPASDSTNDGLVAPPQ